MAEEYLRRIHHVYKYHYVCDGDTDSQHKQWMRNPDLRVLAIPAFCSDWRAFVNELVLLEGRGSDADAIWEAFAHIEGLYFQYEQRLPQPSQRLLQRVLESIDPREIWDDYLSTYDRQQFVLQHQDELEAP